MRGRGALGTVVSGVALAGTLAGARTGTGRDVVDRAGGFLEYYAGVFTLVTMTGAVVFGVVAALRVLPPRPRIVAQAAHRAAAVSAVGFLVTHGVLKALEGHVRPLNLVVPTSVNWVALGTIAGDLLILAAATGAVRGRYAATVRPWAWRVLHCTVYAAWPASLAHGLLAGRTPKSWVTLSYLACAAVIIVLLLIRSATTRHHPPSTGRTEDAGPVPRPEPRAHATFGTYTPPGSHGGAPGSFAGSAWSPPPPREPKPYRERGRKGRRGRHQVVSADERDAAFWESLRAERRDWTRPS